MNEGVESARASKHGDPFDPRRDFQGKHIELILYVGNLPLSWLENDIKLFFQQYGTIKDVMLVKRNQTFTGSALVKFESVTQAEDAIDKLKNTVIPGASHPVTMRWLDTEEQRLGLKQTDEHTLFVGSLPRQANRDSLYQVFSLLGEIESIRLEEKQFWAFVFFAKKESALLAIKYLHGQTYLHGSRIPIEVRFKEKRYNSFMSMKNEAEEVDPLAYVIDNVFHEAFKDGHKYYYNYKTKSSQYEPPPPGAKVFHANRSDSYYIQPEVNTLNDMNNSSRKSGPLGSNLFIFHLPNNMRDSELYGLFSKFGNILSTRVMTDKDGKSKGIGFVSFDNPRSASEAIDEMNHFEIRGKKLKVEINKKDSATVTAQSKSLRNMQFTY